MKVIKRFLEENAPEIKIGDYILVGKFRNQMAKVTGFGKDKNGQPTLKTTKGERKLYPFRVNKLLPKDMQKEEKKDDDKKSK